MLLSQLLSAIGVSCNQDGLVGRLVTDSRQCQPGDLFIGMPGTRVDGGSFALQAIEQGALGAVISDRLHIRHDRVYGVGDITLLPASWQIGFMIILPGICN